MASESGASSWIELFKKCLPCTYQHPWSDRLPSTPASNTNRIPRGAASTRPRITIVVPRIGTKGSTTLGILQMALRGLQASLDVFPPLKFAMGGLLECITTLKVTNRNRQAYDDILGRLANLANQIRARISEANPTYVPYSIDNVARCIEDQTRHIRERRNRLGAKQHATAEEDEEDIVRCYHQIEALFNQLQMDISLSIWDVVREHHVEMRLRGLGPSDDAYYNSALPTTMNKRRGCTSGTRTGILRDSKHWARRGDVPRIYWMNGMAGTGKTTVAYSLCKLLESDKQLGASFFCSRYSPTCRDVNRILPTIAYQLARYSNPYRQALCRILDGNPDAAKRDIGSQFESLIVQTMASVREALPGDLVVVIDALDECSDMAGTKQVLDLLFQHVDELPIKFFLTSRPEPAIANKITYQDLSARAIIHLHDVEESLVQADICTYLGEALASLRPSTENLSLLAAQAGRLFIFAATVVRYIAPEEEFADHNERLLAMLQATSKPANKGCAGIAELYSMILCKAMEEGRTTENETEVVRRVLWGVVCARETLSTDALAEVLGVDKRKVEIAIRPLRSVLNLSEGTGIVSTLHSSFPDYLLDQEQSGRFHCDPSEQNAYLAARCFVVMRQSLRFNICGLETSYQFDRDVLDFQHRVERVISPGLLYTCRYWGDHLSVAPPSEDLFSLLGDFLTHLLLFWLEVLSLKRGVEQGEGILSRVLAWLPGQSDVMCLSSFTYDARNFATTFAANPTSCSVPHIYTSILPFTSEQSNVRRTYWPRTRGLLRVKGVGMDKRAKSPLATWAVGSAVNSLSLSRNGEHILSGSYDGTVSIWDLSSGSRIIGPLDGHEKLVWSVAFSPDSNRVASASADCSLRLWNARNGGLIAGPLRGHTLAVRSVAFSPDGTRLASGSDDHTIRMWDAHTGAPLGAPLEGCQGAFLSVTFSPDGRHLASGSSDHIIRVWDLSSGDTVNGGIEGHTDAVHSVAYSQDGLRLVSGSADGTVRIWNMAVGTLLAGPFQGHTSDVTAVAFSPDGALVVSGSWDKTIRVWEADSGILLAGPLDGHDHYIRSVLFTIDGTRIVSASEDRTIRVWDARQGSTSATNHLGHTDSVLSVSLVADGTRVASGSRDDTICVWDTRNGALLAGPFKGHKDTVLSVAFSPDGKRIVSGSVDCTLRTWDAFTGALLVGPMEGHNDSVRSVSFSPDGIRIASGSHDRTIRLWNSDTGESAIEPFRGHDERITSIAFSPDGTRIVSGSCDNTVRMWGVSNGATPLWTSSVYTSDVACVAFSPNGRHIATGSYDCTILVLAACDGTPLYGPFIGHSSVVFSVAFSGDGTRIVSGSWDQTMALWDVQSGRRLSSPLKGHADSVWSVAFSPDGTRIVSGSFDRTIRIWDVAAIEKASATSSDDWPIDYDGWLTDSTSRRLFWVPPDLRRRFGFLTPSNPIVINATCTTRIEGSTLLGDRWSECYDPLAASALS